MRGPQENGSLRGPGGGMEGADGRLLVSEAKPAPEKFLQKEKEKEKENQPEVAQTWQKGLEPRGGKDHGRGATE